MKKLTHNFLWMSSANVVSGLVNMFMFIYLARVLGAERFGQFSFAQAVVLYLFNFLDLGLSTYGTREIAKEKTRLNKYVNDIISLRFLVAAVLYIALLIGVILSKQPAAVKFLILVMGFWLFTLAAVTEWAFQGIEKMHMVFISLVTTASLQFGLALLLVRSKSNLFLAPLTLFLGSIPITLIYLRILKFKFQFRHVDFKAIKVYLTSALVIWAIVLFVQVYNGFDIIMMGWMRPAEEVGYFTIARRFIAGITFFAVFLANAALPRYAATFKNQRKQFKVITTQFFQVVVAVSAVLILLAVFSKSIITSVVGVEYLPADSAFKILTLGVVFVLLNLPFSTALIAGGFEKEVLKQVIASALLNVGVNIYLIPRWGMDGACLSFVYAEALAVIWMVYAYRKKILFAPAAVRK